MENQTQQSTTIPAEFNAQQAISVLIQAVNFAQTKGIFSLEDAELISKAVKVFVKKEEPKKEDTEPEVNPVPDVQAN